MKTILILGMLILGYLFVHAFILWIHAKYKLFESEAIADFLSVFMSFAGFIFILLFIWFLTKL